MGEEWTLSRNNIPLLEGFSPPFSCCTCTTGFLSDEASLFACFSFLGRGAGFLLRLSPVTSFTNGFMELSTADTAAAAAAAASAARGPVLPKAPRSLAFVGAAGEGTTIFLRGAFSTSDLTLAPTSTFEIDTGDPWASFESATCE